MTRVCVVGVGLSDGPVAPGMSSTMLTAQAFRRALDDAGLEKGDVDGIASAGYGGMHEVMLAEYLGITPRWMESTSIGGSSFEFHAHHAFRAIEAGDVDVGRDHVYGRNQLVERTHTRHRRRWRRLPGRMMMPGPMRYEFPDRLTLVGACDGRANATCISTAPRASNSRRSPCRFVSTRVAIRTAMW